ncbi:TetR/AcrR family transcriptional regulator [Gleimia hominis]|uniref:TetR/AcrR family transcriptional regulator n=1 Tax=Gleimia hominis TaxID=595468 RepID=UPI0018EA98E1|nr:TetR/AcrR family transcriptional regulator [Gleimia hominis]WIK64685.1 TetR/AcrR family transcriptional regulator [Gleimia hominis]
MSGIERREQLIEVARTLFASKGFDSTSVEEIASAAGVTKPVVYEHFGGKEGLYAVIVDREVRRLVSTIANSLESSLHPREIVENTALSLLDYIDNHADGFRVLVRDAPKAQSLGSYSSVIGDVASRVEHLLARQFEVGRMDKKWAPLYAQMLVGLIAQVGQWWLEENAFDKHTVAAHVVNLTWLGLRNLESDPHLKG